MGAFFIARLHSPFFLKWMAFWFENIKWRLLWVMDSDKPHK